MNKLIFILSFVGLFDCMAQIEDSVLVDGELIAVELLDEITLGPITLNSIEKIEFYRLRKKST